MVLSGSNSKQPLHNAVDARVWKRHCSNACCQYAVVYTNNKNREYRIKNGCCGQCHWVTLSFAKTAVPEGKMDGEQRWTFCDPATQWPGNPATRRPSWPGDPVLEWTPNVDLCVKKYSQAKEFLIIIGKSKSSLHGLTSSDFCPTTDTRQWLLSFQYIKCTFCILGIFFENLKNSGLTPGQNNNPVTRTWRMTQMTHWPGYPMTEFHVWWRKKGSCYSAPVTMSDITPHRCAQHDMRPIVTVVAWCVSVCGHDRVPCKNAWTDRDASRE